MARWPDHLRRAAPSSASRCPAPDGEQVGSDLELDEVFVGYLTAYESSWQAYPDVHGCLAALEALGMPLAVLSNGDDAQQRKKLELIGVAEHFARVFTAASLGVAKPQPEAYLCTARELGVSPGACLYVGDDYELDVVAARAAGWQALHLDRTGRGVETGALTTLAEVPGRLV